MYVVKFLSSDLQWPGEITARILGFVSLNYVSTGSSLAVCSNPLSLEPVRIKLCIMLLPKTNPVVVHQSHDWQKRSANFDTALRLLSSVMQQDLLPFHMREHPCLLQPYGDPRRVGGLRIRPMMRCQAETQDALANGYLASNILP